KRQAGRDRLRDRDEVGLDSRVFDSPGPPRATEARLDLVGDEDDPVLVTEPADTLQELRRRDDKATLALNRLDHDRRHRLGSDLRDERALERRERLVRARTAVRVREGHAADLARKPPP